MLLLFYFLCLSIAKLFVYCNFYIIPVMYSVIQMQFLTMNKFNIFRGHWFWVFCCGFEYVEDYELQCLVPRGPRNAQEDESSW